MATKEVVVSKPLIEEFISNRGEEFRAFLINKGTMTRRQSLYSCRWDNGDFITVVDTYY